MSDYRETMRRYRAGTEPDAEMQRRIRENLRMPKNRGWLPLGMAAAMAAGVLLVLWPQPSVDGVLQNGSMKLGKQVKMQVAGTGEARGDVQAMEIDWKQGDLSVEVEPNQGVQLSVITDEGSVRVVGTGFDVRRNALGTLVTVRHGKVSVDCTLGQHFLLTAEQSATCLPVTAAGALGRARQLEGTAEAAVLLPELEAALARPDATGAVASELAAMRTTALLSLGRTEEALQVAEAALAADGGTRAVELHRVAARLRLRRQDCTGALPHLLALQAENALSEDAAWLSFCQQPENTP